MSIKKVIIIGNLLLALCLPCYAVKPMISVTSASGQLTLSGITDKSRIDTIKKIRKLRSYEYDRLAPDVNDIQILKMIGADTSSAVRKLQQKCDKIGKKALLDYCDARYGMPKILIIGSGNGCFDSLAYGYALKHGKTHIDCYSKEMYGDMAEEYFLVDKEISMKPDFCIDITRDDIVEQLGKQKWNIIILENLEAEVYTFEVMANLIKLLAPYGYLIDTMYKEVDIERFLIPDYLERTISVNICCKDKLKCIFPSGYIYPFREGIDDKDIDYEYIVVQRVTKRVEKD